MEPTELVWDSVSRKLSPGLSQEECERYDAEETQRRIQREIRIYVLEHPNCTQSAILAAVEGRSSMKRQVLQFLRDSGIFITAGEGVKGDPFTFVSLEEKT